MQYYGLAAPAGTPRPIVERLNKELRGILASDEMKQRLIAEGSDPVPGTPQDYAANSAREEGKWAALVKGEARLEDRIIVTPAETSSTGGPPSVSLKTTLTGRPMRSASKSQSTMLVIIVGPSAKVT